MLNESERAFLDASVALRARERRAAQRRTRLTIGGLFFALLLISTAAVVAFRLWIKAETAAREARAALSAQLAVQARTVLESHPQRGLLLAVEALNTTIRMGEKPVPVAEDALRAALASSGGRVVGRDDKPIRAVALSSDNKRLVTATDSGVLLWNLSATDPRARPIPLEDARDPVAFSLDNHWLATGSSKGNVQLWDLTAINLEPKRCSLDGMGPITFSPNNHWLVTADMEKKPLLDTEYNALLWDLTSPNPATAPIVLRGHTMPVTELAVSSNGNWLATASNQYIEHFGACDPTVRLWDLTRTDPASGPIVLRGHKGPIGAIARSVATLQD
jgi:hypothetical protein